MMNTKPKYSTKYSVTFWVTKDCSWGHEAGNATRDSIVEDSLTDAITFVRETWPDAILHGSPEGIDAIEDGKTVAKVRNYNGPRTPEFNPEPAPLEIEIERLTKERERLSAELEATNERNKEHKRDIERARLEMLDKGTLISELVRWTETAKRERKDREAITVFFTDTVSEIKRNARAEVASLVRDVERLKAEVATEREHKEQAEEVMNAMTDELHLCERQRDDAQARSMEYARKVDKWEQAYREARKQIEEQFGKLSALRASLASALDERDELRRGSCETEDQLNAESIDRDTSKS
jgi:chromosome segregation ATPase